MPPTTATPVGIDFGSTTSLIAALDEDGRAEMIPTAGSGRSIPSAVYVGDRVLVGDEAVERAGDESGDFVDRFKREIGQPHYHRKIRDRWTPPEVLAAYTMRRLRLDAEAAIGPLGKAIVTVPAYYDERRRHATIEAGKLAGLDVADLVNEPTAAALAYLYEHRQPGQMPDDFQLPEKRLMVYDLGGGTFDVSILQAGGRSFRTLATDGDVRLGGCDFDSRLVDHLAEQFVARHGVDPRADWRAMRRLSLACQQLKHDLSRRSASTLRFAFAQMRFEATVTRVEFEQLIEPLIDRTLTTCGEVLAQAGLAWSDLDELLLVGGSSRVPFVTECLAAKTGLSPRRVDAPEEAVARGAAIYAATQTGDELPPLKVVNVNAHSLGVPGVDLDTSRRINKIVIPRNTPLPASAKRRYVTRHADQRTVKVTLLEGESDNPKHCSTVADCVVQLAPGLPAESEVVVTCRYGSNGTISASAVVPSTQARAHVEVRREGLVELDPLSAWTSRLTGSAASEAASSDTPAASTGEGHRVSAWPGAKRLLRELDELHHRLGRHCASIIVPMPAEPARRALVAAKQELLTTRSIRKAVDERLGHELDQHSRARLQGDAALLGMYVRQAEGAVRQLEVNLGRECAAVDFLPDGAAVTRPALDQRRTALEAVA